MGDWTKVLIYGTFDGFTFSTDELTRINVVLGGGEIVEVPEDFVRIKWSINIKLN